MVAASGNSGIVVLLFIAGPLDVRYSSSSVGASELGVGQIQRSGGDWRLSTGSRGLLCFGFPLRHARLYVQRRPLLRQRSHSGCCLGHATLRLAHVSQLNLSFCLEARLGGCVAVDRVDVDDIVS